MSDPFNLLRFIDAQQHDYGMALSEIRQGKKRTHWIWYIFPQIQGLASSETSRYYAIKDLKEAEAYLRHPLLGSRLINSCEVLLEQQNASANSLFGYPDDLKLQSCMTLFAAIAGTDPIFQQVLARFFQGRPDQKTRAMIGLPE
ncbi:MAG: DUF1810 domain-containing protein [Bacteroidota bacterium]